MKNKIINIVLIISLLIPTHGWAFFTLSPISSVDETLAVIELVAHRFPKKIRDILQQELIAAGYIDKDISKIIYGGLTYTEGTQARFRGRNKEEIDRLFDIAAKALNKALKRTKSNLITADAVKAVLEYHEAVHIQLTPELIKQIYKAIEKRVGKKEINKWCNYFENQYGECRIKRDKNSYILEEIITHLYMERILGNKHLVLLDNQDSPIHLPDTIENLIEEHCGDLISKINIDGLQYGEALKRLYLQPSDVTVEQKIGPSPTRMPEHGEEQGGIISPAKMPTLPILPDIDREDPLVRRILEEIDFLINQDNWGGAATQLQKIEDRALVVRLLTEEIGKLKMEKKAEVFALLEKESPHLAAQLKQNLSRLGIEIIPVGELRDRIRTTISRLRTGDPKVRELARRDLVEIGEPSVKSLTGVLHDEDPGVRELARSALVEIGEPSAGPLTATLHDEDPEVRELARRALVEIGAPSVKSLIGGLHNKDPGVRELARRALVEIGKPSVKPLTGVLHDEDPEVRELARRALVEIGEPSVCPLTATLHDEDPEVRELARRALVEIGKPSVKPLTGVFRDEEPKARELARSALVEIGEPSVKPLIGALGDRSETVRVLAYQGLILLGKVAIGPLTGAHLKDINLTKAKLAGRALEEIKRGIRRDRAKRISEGLPPSKPGKVDSPQLQVGASV